LFARELGEVLYRRAFAIGVPIAHDKIKARAANGVLEVTLPKSDEVRPRRIKIEQG